MARVDADLVRESSTSTGTGSFTVTGAATGEKTFASRCSVGDTFDYCIRAVDGSGVPTGEWEVGEGSYSAANTVSRNTVYASSNSDAAVNFSAGSKQVSMVFTAKRGSWVVEKLTAARTYYVRTDGSDANTGLVDSAAGAFLTIQKAIDVAAAINNNGFDITISVGNGTFTGANTFKSFRGSGRIIIQGNADLTSTVISTTSASCFSTSVGLDGVYKLDQLKLQTTTTGHAVLVSAPCCIQLGALNFGAVAAGNYHIFSGGGAVVFLVSNYTISGGASAHFSLAGGQIHNRSGGTITVTVSGTPAFSGQFAVAQNLSFLSVSSMTFSGSATGTRYLANGNSVIYTNGGGASYLPGSATGSTATGGQYI